MAKTTKAETTERTVQSPDAPAMLAVVLGKSEVDPAERKVFQSGSTGYHTQGKLVIAGQKYQYNLTVTLIGSKPQA